MDGALGSVETNVALLRGSLAYFTGDVGKAYTMATHAGEVSEGVTGAEGLASMLLGLAMYFRGEGVAALTPLERARMLLNGPGWGQAQLTTLGVLALIQIEHGDQAGAGRLLEQAERIAEETALGEAPVAALAVAARGRLHELEGSAIAADKAYARAAMLAARGHWAIDGAHALLLHAAFKRSTGELTASRALLREARRVVTPCVDAGVVPAAIERAERALGGGAAAAAGVAAAPGVEELSERELAVLRLLASELSQREIAGQLFVSFNTIKTHSRTVFRKLRVSSRADAVARGRELGVI
jgi:LuxR family maltose regulon positive regulatory protein